MTPSEKFVPKSVTSADVVDEYKNHDNEIFDSKSKELTDHLFPQADVKNYNTEDMSQASMETEIKQDSGKNSGSYTGVEKNSTILPPSLNDTSSLTPSIPPKPKEK